MPESEFDKQVQQELHGLRLRPSAAVWENVEKELRRKKRRRILIAFWLLAAIGLLGYSGYLVTQKRGSSIASSSSSATRSVESNNTTHTSTPASVTDKQSTPTTPGTQPAQPSQDVTATGTPNSIATDNRSNNNNPDHRSLNTPDINTPVAGIKKDNAHKDVPVNTTVQGTTVKQNTSRKNKESKTGSGTEKNADATPVFVKNKPAKQPANQSKRNDDFVIKNNNPVTKTDKNNAGLTDPETNNTTASAGGENKEQQENIRKPLSVDQDSAASLKKDSAIAEAEPKEPAAVTKPAVKKAASKVKWSLDLAFGGSGPIKSPFLIGSTAEKVAMDNLNAAPNTGQGGIWAPGVFGPVYMPRSDIKAGPAARVGLLAEFPVSKRVSVSTGLQYQYQSNTIRIGSYKDTLIAFSNYASQTIRVEAVYQGSQKKTFTNRYHYLQIPFNFQWQMNSGKKLPVLLNAGLSAGYLITTNGLLYDSLQGGIYYHDKKAFNRFQLTFSTGVSFRFGDRKSFQWSIGPEVSMGLRRMVKPEYDKKQYPVFIGVQGRIYLPTRKR